MPGREGEGGHRGARTVESPPSPLRHAPTVALLDGEASEEPPLPAPRVERPVRAAPLPAEPAAPPESQPRPPGGAPLVGVRTGPLLLAGVLGAALTLVGLLLLS